MDFSDDGLTVVGTLFVFGVDIVATSVERIEELLLRERDFDPPVVPLLRDREREPDLGRLRSEEDDRFVLDGDEDFCVADLLANAKSDAVLPTDAFFFRLDVPEDETLALDFVEDALLTDEVPPDFAEDDDFFFFFLVAWLDAWLFRRVDADFLSEEDAMLIGAWFDD